MPEDCLFCRIASGEVPGQRLYDDDLVVAFVVPDGHPEKKARVHFIVIPKEHVASLAEAREAHEPALGRMSTAAARLAAEKGIAESGYRVVMNTGPDANQTVFHIHMHCLGGQRLAPTG
jgi:histidine triad (HIT) family protein